MAVFRKRTNSHDNLTINRSKRLKSLLAGGLLSLLAIQNQTAQAQQCVSTPVEVGYRTVDYSGGLTGHPTESKPESKLWWTDGSWWGVLWDSNLQDHRIHKFDLANQCWISVGPQVDSRDRSSADCLWDEATQKLYMSSRAKETFSGADKKAYVLRYSYNSVSKTYSLDNGFPAVIHTKSMEALTIAKDSSGQLWATWEESQDIMINRTLSSDTDWGTPFRIPTQLSNVSTDEISAVIAFAGNKIGVMWSDQIANTMYFSVHQDSNADTNWDTAEEALHDPNLGGVADDHINLALSCAGGGGTLLAATKTSLSSTNSPLMYLLKRTPDGVWSRHVFGQVQDSHTRPILLVNANNDSIYFIAKAKTTPVKIYMKRTHLDNPSFQPGLGELFISSSTDDNMNDPTSMKQCVDSETGLLVLVSDKTTKKYLHNYITIPGNPPIVNSFSPANGPVGTEVTITGSNFTGATDVAFNGASAASFVVDSDTQIRVPVPAGASTGKISVTNSDGTDLSLGDFTVLFAPSIASFTPANGPEGTEVTISGSNFAGISDVAFNGAPASGFTVDSGSQIRAQVPPGALTGPITVTNPAGSGTSGSAFTVTLVPNITSFTPGNGLVGSEVTLSGLNFTGTTDIAFNGTSALSFTVDSDVQVRATVSNGATTGKITATNASGSGQSSGDFTVVYTPTISSFTPDTSYAGQEITITGTDFALVSGVTFNGVPASSFTVDSSTQVRAVLSATATTGPVSISNSAGAGSSPTALVVIDPPVILSFNPSHDTRVWSANPANNYGTSVELRVRETSSAKINAYLKFDVSSLGGSVKSAQLRLLVKDAGPDGGAVYSVSNNYQGTATPWLETGMIWDNAPTVTGAPLSSVGAVAVNDTVVFDVTSAIAGDGTYSFAISNNSSDVIKYYSKEGIWAPELVIEVFAAQVPTITSFTPNSGPVGTEVTLTGSDFSGATDVSFNGISAATFIIDSNTQIRANVPLGAATGTIRVTNTEGTGISADAFTVIMPPSLTSFTPASGPAGTEVTVTGLNLTGVTEVSFNGASASAFTIDTDTQVRATVPASASTGRIWLSNTAGSDTSASDFTVLHLPVVTTFSPVSGPVGVEVTLSGNNFTGATSVSFNGTAASSFTVVSDTQLRATVA
ncbi:MAG: IPT/TIG domain-containing protein, partial [bacterium]